MGKKKTPADPNAPKRTRARKVGYFLAKLDGQSMPVIVVSHTHKDALSAVVTLVAATPADLIEAGKKGYRFIDTTAPTPPVLKAIKDAA